MHAIASGDERASRIAAKLTPGRPAISASVDALCQRGLLDRESVDGDQRGTALRLTAAGQSALRAAEQAMAARLDALRGDDRDVLDSLVRLGESLDAALAAKA